MFLSLIRGMATQPTVAAIHWVPDIDMGDAHPAGQVSNAASDRGLTFVISDTAQTGANVLACHPCAMPQDGALLRVDEVCFPVGAIAHRHTHAGEGIRFVVRGSLRIEADDHVQTMQTGDSWFEASGSPVRAVSLHDQGVSSFLRAMIIPVSFEGKSTFALANPDDASLPRLQVTHRHIDLPV